MPKIGLQVFLIHILRFKKESESLSQCSHNSNISVSIMLLWFAKLLLLFSQAFNLGAGSTWPGHILLSLTPRFLKEFDKKFTGKIIVVAGTNGKTTTSRLIRTILEESGKSV